MYVLVWRCWFRALERLTCKKKSNAVFCSECLSEIICADGQKLFEEFYCMKKMQQFCFSFATHAHRHTLSSHSTQSHNSCFVLGISFCSRVVTLLRVFFESLTDSFVFFLGLCYRSDRSFHSRLEIHLRKIVQTKCFK